MFKFIVTISIVSTLSEISCAQHTSMHACQINDAQCFLDMINKNNGDILEELANVARSCSNSPGAVTQNVNYPDCDERSWPKDCFDLLEAGERNSGVYTIYPLKNGPVSVYCDMISRGGGWTLFHRREDGSVNFNRTWDEYREGFGDLNGDHWLGNKHIHAMTRLRRNELLVQL